MKKLLLIALILFAGNTHVNASIGAYLANDDYDCKSDHMVFETSYGYVLAEWYSGSLISGNYFYADFHTYGFENVYGNEEDADNAENSKGYIWIEDFMVSYSDAMEWCNED